MRFPIQMAERAWWMTVDSTRKDNGVKPMDVDHVGVMISAEETTSIARRSAVVRVR